MKIYTKKGDEGNTSLLGPERVPKACLRVSAYGALDELNAHIGRLGDEAVLVPRLTELTQIQDRLFTMGAHLAAGIQPSPQLKLPPMRAQDVVELEQWIDEIAALVGPMREFILPGGHVSISVVHIARCVCRRAERDVVALHNKEAVSPIVLQYLNRLSDYLFMLCRWMADVLEVPVRAWVPKRV